MLDPAPGAYTKVKRESLFGDEFMAVTDLSPTGISNLSSGIFGFAVSGIKAMFSTDSATTAVRQELYPVYRWPTAVHCGYPRV